MDDINKTLSEIKHSLDSKLEASNKEVTETGKIAASTKADLKALSTDFAQAKSDLEGVNKALTELQQKSVSANIENSGSSDFAKQFLNSTHFSSFKANRRGESTMTFQNANVLSTNFNVRTEAGIMVPNRKPTLLDYIARGKTNSNAVHFQKVATASSAGVQNGDGAALTESALAYSDVTMPVSTLSSYKRVSEQALEDVDMLNTFIEAELRDGIRLKTESQIILGGGSSGELSGFSNSNSTESTVTGIDIGNLIDVLAMLLADVGENGGQVSVFAVTYSDYYSLITQADTGNRAVKALAMDNGSLYAFGVPVVPSSGVAADTAYAVGSNSCMLFEKGDAVVGMSDSDGTNFTTGLMTIVVKVKAALVVPYANQIAFADLTALNDPEA